MKVSNFDKLLDRYISGQVSEEERIKIEAWLEVVSVTEGKEDLTLRPEDEERLFARITSSAYGVDEVASYRPGQHKVRVWFNQPYVRIAAAILLMITAGYFLIPRISHDPVTRVASGDIEKIMLADGTLIWLRQNSSITYDEVGFSSDRKISLHGEALFEVAKDAAHPFIVTAGDLFVTVVGTSFNLKTFPDKLELEVLTGKVKLWSSENTEGQFILPNEKVVFAQRGIVEKTPLPVDEISRVTANTGYDMKFSGAEMYKIISRLENKFNVTMQVQDAELYNCRITANLTDHSLSSSLMLISELLDFTFVIQGDKVLIKGKGCK
jgi:ferric-dicitrate binding protein FerR (iron transport regulator)